MANNPEKTDSFLSDLTTTAAYGGAGYGAGYLYPGARRAGGNFIEDGKSIKNIQEMDDRFSRFSRGEKLRRVGRAYDDVNRVTRTLGREIARDPRGFTSRLLDKKPFPRLNMVMDDIPSHLGAEYAKSRYITEPLDAMRTNKKARRIGAAGGVGLGLLSTLLHD